MKGATDNLWHMPGHPPWLCPLSGVEVGGRWMGWGVQMSGRNIHQKDTLFNTLVSEGVTSQEVTRRLSRF